MVGSNTGRCGQRLRGAQEMVSPGWRGLREEKGDRAHPPGSREGGGEILTLVLVRLALALARRWGLTASAIDPATAPSPFVFVKTLRFSQPARFRPPYSSRDPYATTPGEGAAAQGRYGPQRRTNHSRRPVLPRGWRPRPLQSRPHPWPGAPHLQVCP